MKQLYYVAFERLVYTHMGVDHYQLYLHSYYGFSKALYNFKELKSLRSMTGRYKNIVLYRDDDDGCRVILRKA